MGHAVLGVDDLDGYVENTAPLPGQTYGHLDLELIARGEKAHALDAAEGVETETALGVAHGYEGLYLEPEVGEFVGKGVFAGHALGLYVAGSNDKDVGGDVGVE